MKRVPAAYFLGWMSASAFDGWLQDRHGSLDAYILYLEGCREGWIQVPPTVWILIGLGCFFAAIFVDFVTEGDK